MPNFFARRVTPARLKMRMLQSLLISVAVACVTSRMSATTLFFHGNLRTDVTATACGPLCTLGPSNTDAEYAQFAAVVVSFSVSTTTAMQAITYGYGGGSSLTGPAVAAGGLESYLSLFDSSGNFLASTYGASCPAGGQTYNGACYDVALNGGVLTPGTYQLVLSAYFNMSFAENYGTLHLSDGFTGLGNLGPGEDLDYAFDVMLPGDLSAVPEPSYIVPAALALAAVLLFRKSTARRLREASIIR